MRQQTPTTSTVAVATIMSKEEEKKTRRKRAVYCKIVPVKRAPLLSHARETLLESRIHIELTQSVVTSNVPLCIHLGVSTQTYNSANTQPIKFISIQYATNTHTSQTYFQFCSTSHMLFAVKHLKLTIVDSVGSLS